jgi:phosphatidylglycerophosphatase GEP4
VLRHTEKKPAGVVSSLEKHFGYSRNPFSIMPSLTMLLAQAGSGAWHTSCNAGAACRCSSSKLIMVGDRYLTDMVYGNLHGMLTIHSKPLTLQGEHKTVQWVRMTPSSFVRVLRTGTWHA